MMQPQARVRWPPAPALDDETGVGAFDDLNRVGCDRRDARALVDGVGEDALGEGEAPGDPVEDERRAVVRVVPPPSRRRRA